MSIIIVYRFKAFGHADETLDRYISGGLVVWSPQVHRMLEQGELLVKQTRSPETRGFVSVLLAGRDFFWVSVINFVVQGHQTAVKLVSRHRLRKIPTFHSSKCARRTI